MIWYGMITCPPVVQRTISTSYPYSFGDSYSLALNRYYTFLIRPLSDPGLGRLGFVGQKRGGGVWVRILELSSTTGKYSSSIIAPLRKYGACSVIKVYGLPAISNRYCIVCVSNNIRVWKAIIMVSTTTLISYQIFLSFQPQFFDCFY